MKASNNLVEKYGWDKIIHSPSNGRAVFSYKPIHKAK